MIMSRVICLASAKGGSGKTLLTTTFGTFLTKIGRTVLLIDTDAATNGLTLLHLKEVMVRADQAIARGQKPRGVYEDVTLSSPPAIVELGTGAHLIPATYEFGNTEQVDPDRYLSSLGEILKYARERYDYIFIDAQAGSDIFAQLAMSRRVSDEVVIVSEYDPMSAAGVERLKGFQREHLTYERTWVLLNKILPEFAGSFSDFLEVAKYLSPIPWDADVVRAYARRRIALDLESGNEHTLAVLQTLRSLLGEEIEPHLDEWLRDRAAMLRQPIESQYEDAEKMVQALVQQRLDVEVRLSNRRFVIEAVRSSAQLALLLATVLGGLWGSGVDLFANDKIGAGVMATAVVVVGVILSLLVWFERRGGSEREAELQSQLASIERRRALLEEQLRSLEILRSADPEVLLRSRKKPSKAGRRWG